MKIPNEVYKYIAAREQMKQRENDTRNAAILRSMSMADSYGSPRNVGLRMLFVFAVTIVLIMIVPIVSAAPNDPPHEPPFTQPQPVVKPDYPIQDAPGRECDLYQIIITTTRGQTGIDSDLVGYCDRYQAVETMNRINATTFIRVPKGRPIYRSAIALF